MSQEKWDREYSNFDDKKWADRPSLFAASVISFFPKVGRLLELGAGVGDDSRFFAALGYEVVSTDFSGPAVELNRDKTPETLRSLITVCSLDMTSPFPFTDCSFDVVYAHMCIHYFDLETTQSIVSEARRVLKPGGVFAFVTNSTSDPDCGKGIKIEDDFYLYRAETKRYFSVEFNRALVFDLFEVLLLDNQGEAYFKQVAGVHNLIRFVGRKKGQG